MKISDFIFKFITKLSSINYGLCRVRIFIGANNAIFVLITDIGNLYPSVSVTNSIEYICSSLIEKGLINNKSTFIEHYEKDTFSCSSFDIIEFDNNGKPSWHSISQESAKELLGCDDNELSSLTQENKRLISEIDRIKYYINPELDFQYRENHDVIKRRFEINDRMLTKKQLENIIRSGAKEQDIARLIKKDLSILAEIYANPKDEYICFSEFPIEDGYVDYVVLTGRSRMNVYLIEIKGADFNFINKNSYKFNEKISEASQQINTRLGFIFRNYMYFKKNIHDIRRRIENGEELFNSFRGPISNLYVDPDKDINIYTVIIGGRTGDDYTESNIRHDYEMKSISKTKLETWDTFLRKLDRK
ncbi:hypothetical protein RSJ21_04360 [Clostridium botulinum]|uniref:Shedu immune nuclease family protein n=1 Tax=Clostridium botulinum TaxID=1491 RepID=UPI000A177CB4|nr:Shedu immune nuclease family protein [Clostridium botulinum]AUN09686.1 hypothetical protein RSJ6_03915 [Clostridium botulinum]AUN20730.1 hypothetical protein RSJ22_04495 [Clostridium botulinum]AUN24514.1 hypothetical protein RSJ21_04360 [Clostridium botulinum]OSA72839.1 hypothetical protein B2H87_01585 [Clostridium botulinum]QDY20139.1 DUF4263 domain-containing protein [Clostridium botulinum]